MDQMIESNFCSPRENFSFISKPLLSNIMSALWGPLVVDLLRKSLDCASFKSSWSPVIELYPGHN